jgi:hypothetical protein
MKVQTTICGRRPKVSDTGASTRGPIPSMARYVNEDVWKTEVVTSGCSLRKPALAAPFACKGSVGQRSLYTLRGGFAAYRRVESRGVSDCHGEQKRCKTTPNAKEKRFTVSVLAS